MNKRIDIHHITRVEGHGNIVVDAKNGKVVDVEWQVPEAPRFFESMLRGRSWQDVQTIVSRVCGICSISHSLTALKGIEAAMGIEVSSQTKKIRLLTHYSELLQSHVLHIGYLVAPDLLGVKSVIPLVDTHLDTVKTVIKLHRIANQWSELLAGRTTHPVTLQPGGFSKLPSSSDLQQLRVTLQNLLPDLKIVAELLLSLAEKIPEFVRETEYIALVNPGYYTFYDGQIGSTDTASTPVADFESIVNEYVVSQSTAKWARHARDSYAVGALARYNLNGEFLTPAAADLAHSFGLKDHCYNPYWNSIAQLIECIHIVESALEIVEELLIDGIREEVPKVQPRSGQGVGCLEAPRGILFHQYTFDERGICEHANLCIPTNQNHGNIQKDLEQLVPQIIDLSEEEIRLRMEMLVRAYDPCISCSTHYLDITFI